MGVLVQKVKSGLRCEVEFQEASGERGKVISITGDSPIPDLEIWNSSVLTDFSSNVEAEQLEINKAVRDAEQHLLIDKVSIYQYRKKNKVL